MNSTAEIVVKELSINDLRADLSGNFVHELAALMQVGFGEPPWDNDFGILRLILGVGIDIMRDESKAYTARTLSGRHIGHTLGYRIYHDATADARKLSLKEISGVETMNYIFEKGKVFYVDTLIVHSGYRRRSSVTGTVGVGEQLSSTLIDSVRSDGFTAVILRTKLEAVSARELYRKLGFEELSIHDAEDPQRTYWLLWL